MRGLDILHSLLVECVDLGQEGVGHGVAPLADLSCLALSGVLGLLPPAVSSLVITVQGQTDPAQL